MASSFLVGCTLSQDDTSDLKYLYEGHEDFSVIPSFAVIAAQVGWFPMRKKD